MQKYSDSEYENMKRFLSFYTDRYLNIKNLSSEHNPLANIENLEKRDKKLAYNGLRQAINDCVEMSSHFGREEVKKLDSQLRNLGIIALSELRRCYSKGYAKLVKRGYIKNDTEYYLVRNVLDDLTEKSPDELRLLEKLIASYEAG